MEYRWVTNTTKAVSYTHLLGGWFKDNKFYLDISIVENNREKAINIGKYCNQKAIYDIENKITIYLHE